MKIWQRIKALFFWIEFVFSIAILCILFLLFQSQEKIWRLRKYWAKIQKYVINCKIIPIGSIHPQTNLLLINHQSLLDIVVLEDLSPKNISWIAKKELGEIPIFKTIIKKPKIICIDRSPKGLIKLLKEAKQRLNEGRILAIFPEGTRSKTKQLLKFKVGAKILSDKLNLKVQPVVIVDSAKVLDTKTFCAKGGELKIIFLDLIDTSKENWLEEARSIMQKTLDEQRQI
ncbi:lysophospholipid acyltransferase family protein [Campylobacter insulaenigrae]|uniref:1-acyl-sn-glycerol-3-phosphate acyltransferase n=1 Tax=Campylobacter insulaenigrae TaxID=260714 RepID=A0ABY3G3J8_9BACT|nr:lysophospholipid acyltransferase family protein [Campylobacter insulaenigrae]MCR6570149.1 1-acyl-sn-glycerol-3-phosphate acyltransferase [Campylobacter insulaenigrae]MCR6571934.1 1-acyl-sn-glycerol-3-phosphate acyltransferase [Campylobacter insulaenigrae]MCR6576339.1 1-acyl-sn-glycerol-3-phosphate acyltransferase [Campylobacter insulaenigrae]MCR6581282.1 1-acyl-sn-glycerol-3-phosphate acyltransferase [Campylobacter insulaenigrae]MCR6582474.1 1-acyl-sn-glycerol-3-phosphate acyltransferase [C